MENSDLTHVRRSAPYDYVYMEVRKRVGEGTRLKELGQSASASDMDTLKPRVEVETSNRVFPSVGQRQSKLLRWAIQVEVQKTEGPERRVSRVEREDELIQKAMRKRSRKVSREGDFLLLVEKNGLLTTQSGVQEVHERRVRLGGSLSELEDLS